MPREQHLAAEAGCTCHAVRTPSFELPVSLLVWQLARHCTQNPNSLLLESLSWISNKGSALNVKLYYEWGVHRDKTVVKLQPFCFVLPFCFALEVFTPVEKKCSWERKRKLLALFSGAKYWESRDFSRCLSFVSSSCFFSFFWLCSLPRSSAFTFHQHGVSSLAFGALWENLSGTGTLLSLSLLCCGII